MQRWKQNGVKYLSGLELEKEPSWYKILNPIFSGKNERLHLVIGSQDLSLNLQNDSIDRDFESRLTDNENSFQNESLNEEGEQNVIRRAPIETSVNGNKKLAVAPHRKRNVVRSKNQALLKIAKVMDDLAGAQIKSIKFMIGVGKKTYEFFLKHKVDEAQQTPEYKAEEASKYWQYELRLAQIYASVKPTNYLSQGDQWHLSAYRSYTQNLFENSKNVQINELWIFVTQP